MRSGAYAKTRARPVTPTQLRFASVKEAGIVDAI